MKVTILLSRNAGTRYRFPQFIQALTREGIQAEIYRFQSSLPLFLKLLQDLKKADIVVILRKLLSPWKQQLIRRFAKKIVFEYDDSIMYRSSRWENQYSRTRRARFKDMVKICDLIIAGNQFLKGEATKYVNEEKVHVIPTVVDIERYVRKQYHDSKDEVIIGWFGSKGTLYYLKKLVPALTEIGKRFPFAQLKIVCNDFLDIPNMKVIKKEWSETDEVADLQSFDIGLGPLTDDVWTRGKCGLKLVQYLAVGIPVICSPVGANKEIVSDGDVGLWARDTREWIEKLSLLIEKPEMRKKMGEKGRERIEKQYSLQAVAPKLIDILSRL
ncbi:MAG: glycosyltransferase family 4 protein [Deltaproteobacteria bacterium]|nr:glycosyltransferase family 4 protein [Deltaproteobacteria bacterium]